MIGGSRFMREGLTLQRLKDFVALDNLTAQTPLIEVMNDSTVRIWTAYDTTRTHGTFCEVLQNGSVKTVTVYPSGRRHEIINKPPNDTKRLRVSKRQDTPTRNARRTKKVSKGS
jgi:hypothetical protein